MSSRSRSRTRFSAKPLYCGVNNTGSRCTSSNSGKILGNNGWTPNLSQTRKERNKAIKAYGRFKRTGYEGPNNGSVCLQTTLGAMCFATVAAAIVWLQANQASIMKGGRKTRKQYKKHPR
jgi:hypothetical protein